MPNAEGFSMFYEPKDGHGLPRSPFQACVVPRPIGWISTIDRDGRPNLAPFSYYNAALTSPPMVMFTNSAHPEAKSGRPAKDTLVNIENTREFVANMVTYDLRDAMNASSAHVGVGVDEFALAGLETAPSRLVRAPRVKAAPIHLECTLFQIVELPGGPGRNAIVIGNVVGIHIDESVLTDGFVDMHKLNPLSRLGYKDYATLGDIFPIDRPDHG